MRSRGFVTVLMLAGFGITACGDGGEGGDTDTAGAAGDGVRGGALYDSWWDVLGVAAPTTDHPLWASRPDTTNTRSGAETWRCKECHGWDYEGKDGAYGSGSHLTGIAGVRGTAMTPSEVVAMLSDPNGHAFGSVLGEQDLADLAAFVDEYTIDTSIYIRADGSFIGDTTAAGKQAFAANCAGCHGEQGLNTTVVGGKPGFEDFPGLIANDNPPEFLHKVRFGQPGTAMPALAESMPNILGDLGAFAQTLPQKVEEDEKN